MGAMQQSLLLSSAVSGAVYDTAEFVAAGTFVSGTAAISVVAPTEYADGDVLVILCTCANQFAARPSGWTDLFSVIYTGASGAATGTELNGWYKVASGAQAAVSIADSGSFTAAEMIAFRRVNTVNPVLSQNTAYQITASGTWSLPGVTTSNANALVGLFAGVDRDITSTNNATVASNANFSTITEIIDDTTASGAGGGILAYIARKLTAGATGNTSVTIASSIGVFKTIEFAPSTGYNNTNRTLGSRGVLQYLAPSGTAPAATITLETNGSTSTTGFNTLIGNSITNWRNNVVAGSGTGVWVRVTNPAGGTGTLTGTLNTWQELSTARAWTNTGGTNPGTYSRELLLEFATSSGGTPIVARSRLSLIAIRS